MRRLLIASVAASVAFLVTIAIRVDWNIDSHGRKERVILHDARLVFVWNIPGPIDNPGLHIAIVSWGPEVGLVPGANFTSSGWRGVVVPLWIPLAALWLATGLCTLPGRFTPADRCPACKHRLLPEQTRCPECGDPRPRPRARK